MPLQRTDNQASNTSRAGARCNPMGRLRTAFFAQAGELAYRYHITFDRLIAHLWNARHAHRRLSLRSVTHVDDLVHAIACVDDVGMAWSDLGERYERALIRRCRGSQDETEATVFVRRLFAQLRCRNQIDSMPLMAPSLRCYGGTRPLRNWLADRLSAARAREATVRARWQPAFESVATPRRPAIPRLSSSIDVKFWPDINPLKFVAAARPVQIATPPCPAVANIAE